VRSWNRDVAALARLRDGLKAIPDDPPDQVSPVLSEQARPTEPARQAAAQPAQLAAAPPAVDAPPRRRESAEPAQPAEQAKPAERQEQSPPAEQAKPAERQEQSPPAAPARPAQPETAGAPPDPAVAAIRETFAFVANAGDKAVAHFYAWLFVRHPELREMFPVAMTEQRERLFRALVRIVNSLTTPDELAAYLAQLGRDHRKYGVEPWMYGPVGEALITTIRAFSGSAFTPAAEEAWTQAYSAASTLMIRAAEQQGPSHWLAEVVECDNRGHGIAVVTVAPQQLMPYEAGQHVSLQTTRFPRVWRTFSVACAPRADGLMRFHVRAVPGGWVSTALVRHTAPGQRLVLGPALGTMTLQPAADRDLLCVAGGTGLAPMKAITEEAIRSSSEGRYREIFLFWGARTQDEFYDLPALNELTEVYPWFQVIPVVSDDPAFPGLKGNVGQVAARYLPHSDCEAYVAGPAGMVRDTIRALSGTRLPGERIHYDGALLSSGQPDRQQLESGSSREREQ
jgi:NAD(P)H-flavin reductase/hemoglobin-like flavoprotein